MNGFAAIVLVCLKTIPADQCTEANAVDVLSTHVDNELQCTMGWQEMMARMAAIRNLEGRTYLRTVCRRDPG